MSNIPDLESSGVPLSDMIETLRTELRRSMERRGDPSVVFTVEQAELELKVAVSRKTTGGGGIAFWVVQADAGVESQRDFTHTFKLTLKPVSGATGGPIDIAAQVFPGEEPGNH